MSIGCFLDKTQSPSPEELRTVMRDSYLLWERLVLFIDANYQIPGELSYGGKKYGWNLWYRKSGKSLVSLYPAEGNFVAQVVLGREQVERALALSLGETVGRMLRETPQLHDGKWLFIPVNSAEDEQDVEQLLRVKKNLVKRKPVG